MTTLNTDFLVYIMHCINGRYYSGYTNNLTKRYDDHIRGRASKFTRGFKPLGIAQCWCAIKTKSDALKIEYHIKQLPKLKKTELIIYPEILMEKFDCIPLHYARIKHSQLFKGN